MSTDSTWLDEKLKANLYLDMCLRVVVWLVVSFMTIAYASHEIGFSPVEPLMRGLNSLMPVVTDVMRVALVLCILALILKDLEHVAPNSWGQQTSIGRLGGVARKLAGDLTLWIVGALTTVLSGLVFFIFFVHQHGLWTSPIKSFSAFVGTFLVVAITVFSVVSVVVRRRSSLVSKYPKFAEQFNTSWKVFGFYAVLALLTIASDWFSW